MEKGAGAAPRHAEVPGLDFLVALDLAEAAPAAQLGEREATEGTKENG
jgi:hypothetical protein